MVVSEIIRNFASDIKTQMNMATAIKAIPTLYGDEARRFQEMANAVEDNYDPNKERAMTPRQQSAYNFLKREGWIK